MKRTCEGKTPKGLGQFLARENNVVLEDVKISTKHLAASKFSTRSRPNVGLVSRTMAKIKQVKMTLKEIELMCVVS